MVKVTVLRLTEFVCCLTFEFEDEEGQGEINATFGRQDSEKAYYA